MVGKVWKAAKGAMFNDEQAQVYGEAIDALAERTGQVTPQDVVDEAAKKTSRLHGYFEWSDDAAAMLYRRQQAREMLGHLRIVLVIVGDDEPQEVKAFFNVSKTEEEVVRRGYVTVEAVCREEEYLEQVIADALAQLRTFRARYAEVKALRPVFDAIHEVEASLTT